MATHINRQDDYIGNSAFDKDSGRYFFFPSRSDAMVASLALARDVSPDLMDIIFSIIHDQSFNPSEMTLQKPEDIYLHMSKQDFSINTTGVKNVVLRTSGRVIEGTNAYSPVTVKPVSPIVIGEVIRWMDEEIQDRSLPRIDRSYLRQTLMNLALVQRRWVYPVRRALGRLVALKYARRKEALKHFLANPCIGPWTRYLCLDSYTSSNTDEVRFAKVMNVALNEKMTGIHKLTWIFGLDLISTDPFESVLSRLGSVKELVLSALNIRETGHHRMSASQHRSIISLPRLRNLTLEKWVISGILCQALPLEFAPLTPSPSFRALRLKSPRLNPENRLPGVFDVELVWTRDSFNNFSLSTLLLLFNTDKRDDFTDLVLGKFSPLLPQLETLHVTDPADDCLLWIFDRCPKTLHRLFIGSRKFPSEAILRRVPRTVRELTLSLEYWNWNAPSSLTLWKDVCALLCQVISSNSWPELRTFRMYFDHKPEGAAPHEEQFILQEVKILCEERNVEFVIVFYPRPQEYCYDRQIKDVLEDMDILHDLGLEEMNFRKQIPTLRIPLPKSPSQDETSEPEYDSSEYDSDY